MFTRRIIVSACTLALALPVAAGARPAFDQPTSAGSTPTSHGDTKYDLQNNLGTPAGVTGDTKGDLHGAVPKLIAPPASSPTVAPDNGTNGWRIAAVAEAGVLAALALGGGLAFGGHLRPRRRATAA